MSSSNRLVYLLIPIVLLGAFLRFFLIGAKTVWLDEAFSIWIANHGLQEGWSWLVRIDHHPPLYYAILHFWQRVFGDLQGPVRALSAACGTLAIPFFFAASRRFFDIPTGLLAAFILAISPFHVRFAQEARMYALLSLAAAVALYFLARVLFCSPMPGKRGRLWLWIGLAVAQAAVMLSHNTAAVFFPLAVNLPILGALLVHHRRRQASSLPNLAEPGFLGRWLLCQGLALLLWLPWAAPFAIQARVVDGEFWILPPTLPRVLDAFQSFNFAFIPDWVPALVLWNLLYGLLALLGLWSLRRTPARALLLLSLFLTPIVGELLVSLRRPIFYDRTLIWATLPYLMLVAGGVGSLAGYAMRRTGETTSSSSGSASRRPILAAGALAMIVALSSLALFSYYFYFDKEDWAKAAEYVAANVEPGDLVLFNATWVQIPFEYYFRHYDTGAELAGLPVNLFERGVLEPKMTEADAPYLHSLVDGRPDVWLIYSHDWYTDPSRIIPRELAQAMRLSDQREFVGLQVMHYKNDE